MRVTIAKAVREHELRDDAEQGAFLKLLQAVSNWNDPERALESGEALAKWMAHKAALNVVELRDRNSSREDQSLSNEEVRDVVEYRASQIASKDLSEEKQFADYARYASERAGSPRRAKLWGSIILAVADDLHMRGDIGEVLGIPAVSVRREVHQMNKRLSLKALDHVEELVPWTAVEQPEDADLALFNYDWREIS